MITYNQLQEMSKEICELDRLQWLSCLNGNEAEYKRLEIKLKETIELYELAYRNFYGSDFCQQIKNNSDI